MHTPPSHKVALLVPDTNTDFMTLQYVFFSSKKTVFITNKELHLSHTSTNWFILVVSFVTLFN